MLFDIHLRDLVKQSQKIESEEIESEEIETRDSQELQKFSQENTAQNERNPHYSTHKIKENSTPLDSSHHEENEINEANKTSEINKANEIKQIGKIDSATLSTLHTLLESLPTTPLNGWERAKLGEVSSLTIKKGTSITQKQARQGNIKVVAGGLEYAYFHDMSNRPKNTITISASGANAGFVNYWNEEIFASDCTTINSDSKISIKFIYYTLRSIQKDIYRLARGSAQPHVYPKDIESLQIPLPPLKAQEQIVSVIEEIESKIKNIDSKLEGLEKEKASILQRALHTDTRERERERERDEAELKLILNQIEALLNQKDFWHNAFSLALQKCGLKQTKPQTLHTLLESLPTQPANGWERVKLGEIAEIIAGQSPESKFYNDKGSGFLFFQGKKDFGDKILQNSNVWTSQITKESVKNDILMSVRAPVGDININPYESICIGRGLCAIRAKNSNFLFHCIKVNKHLFVGRQGMAFDSISVGEITQIKIPFPPLHDQESIVSFVEKIESSITHLDSLLPMLETKKQEILKGALINKD